MIGPKAEKEELLLSITKNCETLIKQFHTKPEESSEFKLSQSRQTFHFNPLLSIESSWMLGLTSLEVYSSNFNITEENNKFALYTDNFDEFPFFEPKDELDEILNIQILHHIIYNMRNYDRILFKLKGN